MLQYILLVANILYKNKFIFLINNNNFINKENKLINRDFTKARHNAALMP